MSFNPRDKQHIQRLRTAMEQSYKSGGSFRRNRLSAVKEFVGDKWSDGGADHRVPLNVLALTHEIYLQHLVSASPAALVVPKHSYRRLKPDAMKRGLALTNLAEEIHLGDTLRRWAAEGLFSMGLLKVGLAVGAEVEIDGFIRDNGQLFSDLIDLDDWVHDMSATNWYQMGYCGHRYAVDLDRVKESKHYNRDMTEGLQASEPRSRNPDGTERVDAMGGAENSQNSHWKDQVWLWDIWIPDSELVLTFVDNGAAMPIKTIEWQGPEVGPYHQLGFTDVPGNIKPLPTHALGRDMHEALNRAMRKVVRQMENEKTVGQLQGAQEEEAQRIMDASDGHVVATPGGTKIDYMKHGGINPNTLAFALAAKQLAFEFAGNLESLGGLSPSSDTVGQDKLISAASNKKMIKMQTAFEKAVSGVFKSMGWYMEYDPLIEIPVHKRVPGTNIEVPATFSPEDKEGDYWDYNYSVAPYSMKIKTPSERLAILSAIFDKYILPMMPLIEQRGGMIDFQDLFEHIAEYSGSEEIRSIITWSEPLPRGEQPALGGERGQKSPHTVRENIRTNRSGATNDGATKVMVDKLLSQGRGAGSSLSGVG